MNKHKCYTLDFLQHCYFLKSLISFSYENDERKIVYQNHKKSISGYVIGSKLFYEGDYSPPSGSDFDYDPGELKNRKGVKFYKVATDFNVTYYVPIDCAIPMNKG